MALSLQSKVAMGAVSLLITIFASITYGSLVLRQTLLNQFDQDTDNRLAEIHATLESTDEFYRQKVDAATKILQNEVEEKGSVSLGAPVKVGDAIVPELKAGDRSLLNDYTIVDRVRTLLGATATLFVKQGDDYFRVSTNVLKPNGDRAIGTKLDPLGAAYRAIHKGEAYSGLVDILGTPYFTAYIPMKDVSGKLIGIWYTGYSLASMKNLTDKIENSGLLGEGYAVVLDQNMKSRFRSKNAREDSVDSETIKNWAKDSKDKIFTTDNWSYRKVKFEPWNYTVIFADHKSDVTAAVLALTSKVLGPALLIFILGSTFFILMLRSVIRRLSELIIRLSDASHEVTDASKHVYQSGQDLGAASTQQSDSMNQATEALKGVTDMIVRNVETANSSEKISASSFHAAKEGQSVMVTMRDAMKGIIEGNVSLRTQTDASASQFNEITKIISDVKSRTAVINEIVFQTRLLSFNASVEAARAGEHGLGFSVVAEEIGKLAQMSGVASTEISDILESSVQRVHQLANDNRTSIEPLMKNASDLAHRGIEIVEQCNTSLGQLVKNSENAKLMAEQISGASREQAEGARGVTTTITQLELVTQNNNQSVQESIKTAKTLSQQAKILTAAVHDLRLTVYGDSQDADNVPETSQYKKAL